MKIVNTNTSTFESTSLSLSSWQLNDSSHVNPESTLTSSAPNEQGCCAQILDLVRKFIHWLASFFCCSTPENLETLEGLKDYMTRMDACFDQKDGPVILLKDLVRVCELPLKNAELQAQHNDVFSFIIHTITTSPEHFVNNRMSVFFETIGDCREENLDYIIFDRLIPLLSKEPMDFESVKPELILIVDSFNLENARNIAFKLLSQLFASKASPSQLIEDILQWYGCKSGVHGFPAFAPGFANFLAINVDVLRGNLFQTTAQSNFYLTIGTSLLETGRLDQELIFQKLNEQAIEITDEIARDLKTQIDKFNNREALKWDELYQDYRSNLLLGYFNNQERLKMLSDDSIQLVHDLIDTYKFLDITEQNPHYSILFPNLLALMLSSLQTDSDVQDSSIKHFYLSVGQELQRTGKLNEEEILRQCNPSEEVRTDLVNIIREFNQRSP